jgi:hypothetical protein
MPRRSIPFRNSGKATGNGVSAVENEHTLNALLRKRAELAGQFEHYQAKARQLLIDIDNVDATIRMFAPEMDLTEIKPKPMPSRHAAYKGEVARIILGTLREAGRACSTQELTMHVMAERGMNTADKRLVKTVSKRVGACLRHHRVKGLIQSSGGIGKRIAWEITR